MVNMTFHMDIIKECFASWLHLRACQVLMRQPKSMSERQLSRLLGVSSTTLHRALNALGQTGLIRSDRVGNASFWRFDRQSYLFETLKPILDGLNTIVPPIQYLKGLILKTLRIPKNYRLILFGSTTKGTDTSSSDIDICILCPSPRKKAIHSALMKDIERLEEMCMDKFGKALNPIFVQETKFRQEPDKELHRNISRGVEIKKI